MNSFIRIGRLAQWFVFLVVGLGRIPVVTAHPMPNSVVLLNVHADRSASRRCRAEAAIANVYEIITYGQEISKVA